MIQGFQEDTQPEKTWYPMEVIVIATGEKKLIKSKAFTPELYKKIEAEKEPLEIQEVVAPPATPENEPEGERIAFCDSCTSKGGRHLKVCPKSNY